VPQVRGGALKNDDQGVVFFLEKRGEVEIIGEKGVVKGAGRATVHHYRAFLIKAGAMKDELIAGLQDVVGQHCGEQPVPVLHPFGLDAVGADIPVFYQAGVEQRFLH